MEDGAEFGEVIRLGDDGLEHFRSFGGELIGIGIFGRGLKGEDEPAELLAEGFAEGFVRELVGVGFLPIAEIGARFLHILEVHLFLALEVEIHGCVIGGHGSAVCGDGGAEAGIDL